jgi:flavin reductase (DIM6/NTAB) family NADH-FMN oxidoreductase RutF
MVSVMKKEIPLAQVHRLFAPRPVCLLTTRYKGRPNVMSVAWICSVSLAPPLLITAIHPSRYTHDILRRSGEWVLNIPGRALAEQVIKCGSVSGENEDKIALTGLTPDAGRRVDVPWIAECLAHVECTLVDTMMAGDHTLFVAEVAGAWAEEEAFSEFWLAPEENEEMHPLIHLGGKRFCLLGKVIATPSADR